MMEILIKRTGESEFFTTEILTREAFWNLYKPGCDEHLLLHRLRESKSYISSLDLVAVHNNRITGHIIATIARVSDDAKNEHEVLCAGPLSVLPGYQKQGIGAGMMKYLIAEARKLNYSGIILFGDPDYYRRFGFKNARAFGITTRDNKNFDAFMALELHENSLAGVKGRFFEDDIFLSCEDGLKEFDRKFPYKKKQKPKRQITMK